MGFYAIASLVVLSVWLGLVLLIRRNLRQREKARRYRTVFVSVAEDLISKPEFPDRHAKNLAEMSAFPEGWITRFMVIILLKEMLVGKSRRRRGPPKFNVEDVPQNLRVKYVVAIFAFALGDSYRCAILGRMWRAANPWVGEAIDSPKVDVNAHATTRMVDQVSRVRAPHHVRAVERQLEGCTA